MFVMRHLKSRFRRPARIYAALGAVVLLVCLLISASGQQFGGRRGGRRFPGRFSGRDGIPSERYEEQQAMEKAIDPAFKEDVFTFARVKFENDGYGRAWDDDTPNADLMLTFRMFQVTSLKVRPGLHFIDITTKELADYPFVYMAGAGQVALREEEATALRQYLLNGGFMMVEDFWGDEGWEHFNEQLKLIFPNRAPEPMDLNHQIFNIVYKFKKQPQIPSAGRYFRGDNYVSYDQGYNYQRLGHDPHYFGVYDDKRRLVMLICHNNHYGDGWEHEGEDETYFDLFSEPMGYPMFINILAYTMSH